jgi:hypothetical protein
METIIQIMVTKATEIHTADGVNIPIVAEGKPLRSYHT